MANSTTGTKVTKDLDKQVFIMERVFDAPLELAFKAFSDADLLAQWWGPKGWTLPVCNLDFRPGGVWHYCMRGPGGEESWGKAIYQEIVEPERIVYTDIFSNEEGTTVEGMPQTVVTVTFAEQDGKTKITSRTKFASAADLQAVLDMGLEEGATEVWDRLAEFLERQR